MIVKAELQGAGWKELYKWCSGLSENTDYTLSMRVKGSGAFWLGIKDGNWQAIAGQDVFATTEWTEVRFDFNTGWNTGIHISVQDQVAAGTAYIDDVKVTKKADGSVVFTENFENGLNWNYAAEVYSLEAGSAAPVTGTSAAVENLGVYVWDRNPEAVTDFGEWIGRESYRKNTSRLKQRMASIQETTSPSMETPGLRAVYLYRCSGL